MYLLGEEPLVAGRERVLLGHRDLRQFRRRQRVQRGRKRLLRIGFCDE